jgi:hypothetical protein
MGRLIAIAAVFSATACLDRQEARFLHFVGVMDLAMQALRGEDQIIERRVVDRFDLLARPVKTGFGER